MCNLGYFLSYVGGLGTSYMYACSFLASTHARFSKELYKEMSNKENFPQDCLHLHKFIKDVTLYSLSNK